MEYIPPTIETTSEILHTEEISDESITISLFVLVYIQTSIEFNKSKEDDIFVSIETTDKDCIEFVVNNYIFYDSNFLENWFI